MKIRIDDREALSRIDGAVIHSLEGGLYTCYMHKGEQQLLLCNKDNKALIQRCLQTMKAQLAALGITEAFLLQKSAYDEMIGHGEKGENALLLKVSTGLAAGDPPPTQH